MAGFNTDGDGSVYIKGTGGKVTVGAGSTDQLTVSPGSTQVNNQLNCVGDINAQSGGMVKTYEFFSYRTLQNSKVFMTSSQINISGTAAAGNALQFTYLKYPIRGAGSVVGVMLLSEDGIVSAGGLTASLFLSSTYLAGATVAVPSGSSMAGVSFAKDTYTVTGPTFLQVMLTASSDYLNTVANSASWSCIVELEY